MIRVLYVFIGMALIFAVVAGSVSLPVGAAGLGVAYFLHRGIRWIRNDGTLLPEAELPDDGDDDFAVLAESDDELVMRGSVQALVVNRRARTVSNRKKVLCTFDQVRCIRIHRANDSQAGCAPSYSVSLSLGVLSSICLGESADAAEASRAAAQLAKWTGKDVLA